jgi:hypothetical protein
MFKALMSIENEQAMSDTFKVSATILGMKQTDAMVRVLVKFIENCDAYIRILLNQEPNLGVLITGIQNLELYFGIMRVFTSGGGAQKIENKVAPASPFGKPAPVSSDTIQKNCVIPIGNGKTLILPNTAKSKNTTFSQPTAAPTMQPTMMPNPGFMQPMGTTFNPFARNTMCFGKPVAIDNTQQLRSQGPKVRPILSNGKLV